MATHLPAGLCAFASHTRKKENQDCGRALPRAGRNAVVLADGLGSLTYASAASREAVAFVAGALSSADGPLDCKTLFDETKRRLQQVARMEHHKGDEAAQYGTTLLLAQETATAVRLAYVGNGAIWHVRPHTIREPARQLLPWSVVNYLNPHSRDVDGAEALYRLVSGNDLASEVMPTVLDVAQDEAEGDIFVLCTDGIYSADQPTLGKNPSGLWVRADPQALGLVAVLRQALTHPHPNNSLLTELLDSYLVSIEAFLDDDASIGILITGKALAYLAQPTAPPDVAQP